MVWGIGAEHVRVERREPVVGPASLPGYSLRQSLTSRGSASAARASA